MTDHYDALETRQPAEREAELFSRLPEVLRKAMAAPAYAERLAGYRSRWRHQPGGAGAAAAAAQIRSPCPAQIRPAVRRPRPGASRLVWEAVYLARPDFRAGGHPRRPLARRPGAVCRRVPAGRRGAEHLQLSPDAGRLHLRCLGARARLRGDSGRSRQYRGAIRADRGLSAGRLQRHPGFPQNPARRRRGRRTRRLLDQARAGVGGGIPEIAAGRRSNRAGSMPTRPSAPPISA